MIVWFPNRIRTNYTAHPHGSLMLPVSLEVTSQPLLFCPQQFLDFGVVNNGDPPKTVKLFVINSGSRPITIQARLFLPFSNRFKYRKWLESPLYFYYILPLFSHVYYRVFRNLHRTKGWILILLPSKCHLRWPGQHWRLMLLSIVSRCKNTKEFQK